MPNQQIYFGRVGSIQIGKANTEGLLLRGFRFTFDITKTETSDKNKCAVTISNLTRETQNKIKIEDGNLLIVNAGYQSIQGERVAFLGDITDVSHDNTGPDVMTTIKAEDGRFALRKRSTFSFAEGSNMKQVIEKVIKEFDIPTQTVLGLDPLSAVFQQGLSFIGPNKNLMDKLTSEANLSWSVQNNELKVYPKGSVDSQTAIIKLSPNTGLIGSPKRVRVRDKEDSDKNFDGWDIECLLQPQLEPGGRIALYSADIAEGAQFGVVEVKHTGDTHGEQWRTKARVRDLV